MLRQSRRNEGRRSSAARVFSACANVIEALELLEDLVHNLDNAADLVTSGGFHVVVDLVNRSSSMAQFGSLGLIPFAPPFDTASNANAHVLVAAGLCHCVLDVG